MKKIKIKVIPNAKKDEVIREINGTFTVRVKNPPDKGKANKRVIKLLKKELGEKKVVIVKGEKSRNKIVEV